MDLNNGITIIGGGIGGLTVANALQKAGFAFDLYEQAPELTEAGAGIGLSNAALDILDRIDLGTDVRDQGVSIKNVYLADKQMNIRRKLAVRLDTVCIHRALLIDILKSRLPAESIHLSKQAVDVKSYPDYAEILFSDNTSIHSQCLIAADGINSLIRLCLKSFFPDVEKSFSTYYRLRREKVMSIVKTSWQFGRAAHSRNPFKHYLYRALLEYAPAVLLEKQESKLNDLTYLEEIHEKELAYTTTK